MRYVVAVSGGVDSVVLLDMLARMRKHELIVAHFDHGIRPDSAADARFVKGLAQRYGLGFVTKREELGESANEELARSRRYRFLTAVAERYEATIVTAHHADDVIESIVINLVRGTGWRGLAVFGHTAVARPLLRFDKKHLRRYALKHGLEWVEDETNQQPKYLRNRVRRKLTQKLTATNKRELYGRWLKQTKVREAIDAELLGLLRQPENLNRYFFSQIDDDSSLEILRALLAKEGLSLTRPQRTRLLLAIKTAKAGKRIQLGDGVVAGFTSRDFTVKSIR